METKTFADLGLSPKVQAAITAAGYANPTPIQAAAIPVAVTGRDVLGIAQTGTGKTASFVLPMITRLETGRARARMPRSLILAPTRELAAQVAQSFEKYGVNHKLQVALLIGGVSMDDQVKKLDRGVDVLIATPGRLLDHFGRGRVMLMGVEILVIDEADRMLDMGFIPDIEKICKLLPPRRQTLFFSATMPPEITRLVNQFLNNPERIEVAKPATTAKTITQRFVYCPNGEDWAKRDVLRNLIREGNVKNAIIFCNRKRDVAVLFKSLTKHGFNAGALHGDMDQASRMDTLDKFRAGEIMLLAASDVAARGLDIPDVSHVFNFDLPWAADDYVHRIGRTGRAGREGYAASLVSPDDLKFVKDIEKITGEAPVWLGDAPSEEDFASAGKRRRGRGGRGQSSGADKSRRPQQAAHRAGRPQDHKDRAPEHRERQPQQSARQPHHETSQPDYLEPIEQSHRQERRRTPRPERAPQPQSEQPRQQHARSERSRSSDHSRSEQPRLEHPRSEHPRSDQPSLDHPRSEHARSEHPRRSAEPTRRPQRPKPAPDAWTDEPAPAQRHARHGHERPEKREAAREAPRKQQPSHKGDERLGFAENVPAFMRKPPRPIKVPGRG
ncbi:DEAD/DEAH box helicase [Hyphomicrobium sp.]|uniref:DEAD/DEAH box helicase n=1 Tax=Hyphomicrobium sp. TaxID=82 RepID=UPI001DCECD7A|nr:DEAD/DEAH box helicase [Hyphomicrobium sp.]MBY0561802.1 DEAD/DEAH box helicase [Hyphomicrobium sp.]